MAKLDSTKPYMYSAGGAAVCVGYSCCADWLVMLYNEYLDIDVLPMRWKGQIEFEVRVSNIPEMESGAK